MPVNDLKVADLQWRKARRSVGNGACVELSSVSGWVFIRDSKAPEGPILSYHAEAFQSFLGAAKEGAFPP